MTHSSTYFYRLLCCGLFLFTGLGTAAPNEGKDADALDRPMKTRFVVSKATYKPKSTADDTVVAARVRAMDQFSFDLYHQLLAEKSAANLVFSPLSLQGAFSLLYPSTSADLRCGKELSSVMRFDINGPKHHESMKAYLIHLQEIFSGNRPRDSRLQWNLVNQVWTDNRYGLQPGYLTAIKTYYDAGVATLDLTTPQAQESSRQTINAFVESKTNSLIKDLLPRGSINAETKAILTNSVYMLADWLEPFAREQTRKEGFFLSDETTTLVDMMKRTGRYEYTENAEFKALSMPYIGDEIAMLVVLPRGHVDISAFAKNWQADDLLRTLAQLNAEDVAVSLPRFDFRWGSVSLRDRSTIDTTPSSLTARATSFLIF